MSVENEFARLIERLPKVTCPKCSIEMPLRTLVPSGGQGGLYAATFRCSECGIDTQREFNPLTA